MSKEYIVACDGAQDYMYEMEKNGCVVNVKRLDPLFEEIVLRRPTDDMLKLWFKTPLEISFEILKYTVVGMLKEMQLSKAFRMLICCGPLLRQFFYRFITGETKLKSQPHQLLRLSKYFELAVVIYDELLTEPSQYVGSDFVALLAAVKGRKMDIIDKDLFYPWDIKVLDMALVSIEPPIIENQSWLSSYNAYHLSQFYGDTIWAQGNQVNGIFKCKKLMHPVINFQLMRRDWVLRVNKNATTRYYFKKLSDFFILVFGPTTAVHYVTGRSGELPENIFDVRYKLIEL